MARFIINKDGVYYLTTGKLLTYDMRAAKTDSQRHGVEEVKRKFDEVYGSPHTHYPAVEVTNSNFSPANTGDEPI